MSCRSIGLRRLRVRRSAGLRSAGFTLVELLVVISIIGMLMALLLPAVQQAREAGRRNTCNSNLHNVALAVMNFATSKNAYPGYVEALPVTVAGGSASTTYVFPVNWTVPILPYMERTDIYTLWRNMPQWSAAFPTSGGNYPPPVYMSVLNCPSTPPSSTANNTPCAYVANSGMLDVYPTAGYPADWQANGIFFNHYNPIPAANGLQTTSVVSTFGTVIQSMAPGTPVQTASVSQDYITVHDGSSLTLMLSENNNAPYASVGSQGGAISAIQSPTPGPGYWGTGTSAPVNASGLYMFGTEPQNCFVWWPDAQPYPSMKINAPLSSAVSGVPGGGTATTFNYFMHPASNHPTGTNVAFCDGHSQFISQDIDYTVFCLLMTPYGAFCNTPGYTPATGGAALDPGSGSGSAYYPNASNYGALRSRPVDEAQIQ